MTSRLPLLRSRPQYAHLSDDICMAVLDEASLDFEAYTNHADPGRAADSVVVELACIKLNMLGAEGSSSASEEGISRSWDVLPESLRIRMDRWRRPVFGRSTCR